MQSLDNDGSDNTNSATTLWRMYSKAKAGIPYRSRMENLTWRLMFLNLQKARNVATIDQSTSTLNNSSNNKLDRKVSDIEANNFHNLINSNLENSINVNTREINSTSSLDNLTHINKASTNHPRPIKSEFDYLDHIKSLSSNESYLSTSNDQLTKAPHTRTLRNEIPTLDNKQQPSKLSQTFQNHHLVSSPRDSQALRNIKHPHSSHSFSQLHSMSFSNAPSATTISRGSSDFNIHEDLNLSSLSHSASPTISNSIYHPDDATHFSNFSTSIPTGFANSHSISETNDVLLDHGKQVSKTNNDIINFQNFFDSPNDQNLKHIFNEHNIDHFDFNNNRELSINHNMNFDLDGDLNMFDTIHTIQSNHSPNVNNETPVKSTSAANIKSHSSIKISKKQTALRRRSTSKKRKPDGLISTVTTPASNLNSSSALSTPTPTSTQSPSRPASTTSETAGESEISCTNCHTKTTPLWRRNPEGQPLCNACGLFLKLHGVVRPLSLKTDVIKKRQRGGSSMKKKKGQLPNTKLDGDDLYPTPIMKEDASNNETNPPNSIKREKLKSNIENSIETNLSIKPTDNETTRNLIEIHNSLKPMFSLHSPDNVNSNDSIFHENFDMSILPDDFLSNNHTTQIAQAQEQHFDQSLQPSGTQTNYSIEEKEQNWDWLNMQI